MKTTSQGKIFLADQRGIKENGQLRRFSTFNFEGFSNPYKTALDELYVMNEDLLVGGQGTTVRIEADSYVLILPITGAVIYTDDMDSDIYVEVEELMYTFVRKGVEVCLSNPFENDVVTYLFCCLKADKLCSEKPRIFNFNLKNKNQLIHINDHFFPFKISIGRFDGRKDAMYELDTKSKLYTFVISGAFEIDGRLMHEKDSLALWNTAEVEFEALNNNALVLTIESARVTLR